MTKQQSNSDVLGRAFTVFAVVLALLALAFPVNPVSTLIGNPQLLCTNGTDGTDGTNGTDGVDGTDGTNGTNGVDGKDGTDGTNGTNGVDGKDGTDGTNGTNGTNGVDGICTTGDIGPIGPQGIQGEIGPAGEQGIQGIQGPRGLQGIQGEPGVAGRDGVNGLGDYGSFYSTETQTNEHPDGNGQMVPNDFNVMTLNQTDSYSTRGVSIIDGSKITFSHAGTYNLAFSAQLDKLDSGTDNVAIWLTKGGADLSWTATMVDVNDNAAKVVAAWNFFVTVNANDYIQLKWKSADHDLRLLAQAANGFPAVPSLIATVNQVG